VFLPGFQKGRDIALLKEKGREQFWQKKGQFASYKEKLEKWTEFTTFRVNNKMLPISFNTSKTL
jgi:hypothetical protein